MAAILSWSQCDNRTCYVTGYVYGVSTQNTWTTKQYIGMGQA